jgi:hypothetical protein
VLNQKGRIVGTVGGPKAVLDFRITDLRVRGESLANIPAKTSAEVHTSAPVRTAAPVHRSDAVHTSDVCGKGLKASVLNAANRAGPPAGEPS